MSISTRMLNIPVEILEDYGEHEVEWSESDVRILLAKFNWPGGETPEDRFVLAHNLVADDGKEEIVTAIDFAKKITFKNERELNTALGQAL